MWPGCIHANNDTVEVWNCFPVASKCFIISGKVDYTPCLRTVERLLFFGSRSHWRASEASETLSGLYN